MSHARRYTGIGHEFEEKFLRIRDSIEIALKHLPIDYRDYLSYKIDDITFEDVLGGVDRALHRLELSSIKYRNVTYDSKDYSPDQYVAILEKLENELENVYDAKEQFLQFVKRMDM